VRIAPGWLTNRELIGFANTCTFIITNALVPENPGDSSSRALIDMMLLSRRTLISRSGGWQKNRLEAFDTQTFMNSWQSGERQTEEL
jgi:hypothetical protein